MFNIVVFRVGKTIYCQTRSLIRPNIISSFHFTKVQSVVVADIICDMIFVTKSRGSNIIYGLLLFSRNSNVQINRCKHRGVCVFFFMSISRLVAWNPCVPSVFIRMYASGLSTFIQGLDQIYTNLVDLCKSGHSILNQHIHVLAGTKSQMRMRQRLMPINVKACMHTLEVNLASDATSGIFGACTCSRTVYQPVAT